MPGFYFSFGLHLVQMTRQIKILALLLLGLGPVLFAQQPGDVCVVAAKQLNMRTGPGTGHPVVMGLQFGQPVLFIEKADESWWKVKLDEIEGFVSAKYLSIDSTLKPEDIIGWEKVSIFSGSKPDCYNIKPEHDREMDNFLKVNIGTHTDVVIKLIEQTTDQCIRIVYINSNDSYHIRHIPEGDYYLKIAYGQDLRKKIIDGQCYVKFLRNPLYEKGEDILDYHVKVTTTQVKDGVYENYSIPSYELWLDMVWGNPQNNFNSTEISEGEFNN